MNQSIVLILIHHDLFSFQNSDQRDRQARQESGVSFSHFSFVRKLFYTSLTWKKVNDILKYQWQSHAVKDDKISNYTKVTGNVSSIQLIFK